MKKNHLMHKTLSLVLILSMFACCTACGCGATFEETPNGSTTTESGMINDNSTTDGIINETTTTDGTMNNSTEHNAFDGSETSTEKITDGTESILQDTIDGVMNDVRRR